MNLIKAHGTFYKKGIHGKVYYLSSFSEWIRANNQAEWIGAFKLAQHLLTCSKTNSKNISKDIGWSLVRTARSVAFLKLMDLLHVDKKGAVRPTDLLFKSIEQDRKAA
jgi:hypothetical protein